MLWELWAQLKNIILLGSTCTTWSKVAHINMLHAAQKMSNNCFSRTAEVTLPDKQSHNIYHKGKWAQWVGCSAVLAHVTAMQGFVEGQHCWSGFRAVILLGLGWKPDWQNLEKHFSVIILKCKTEKAYHQIIWQVHEYFLRYLSSCFAMDIIPFHITRPLCRTV